MKVTKKMKNFLIEIECDGDIDVEGMKELMPVYHVIGKIPIVRNISNKIIVMEKHG